MEEEARIGQLVNQRQVSGARSEGKLILLGDVEALLQLKTLELFGDGDRYK